MEAPSEIVVYRARSVHTMDPDASVADAVAVRGDRVIAVGRLDEVLEAVTDGPVRTDDTFAGAVLLPGLIDQHLHPLLGATTLATEVIATEDWVLPGRVLPAASSPGEYDE
ncbi:MAG: amidohydrolase, partial [Ilumatobacteraceae bacterium]